MRNYSFTCLQIYFPLNTGIKQLFQLFITASAFLLKGLKLKQNRANKKKLPLREKLLLLNSFEI